NTDEELRHKLGESIWWLVVLSERMNIDIEEAVEGFLSKTEKLIGN
ncbi:MazG-like protein, partial [Flavobacterium circumlabens]